MALSVLLAVIFPVKITSSVVVPPPLIISPSSSIFLQEVVVARIPINKEKSAVSVSYTHLDVYKRQD